MPRSEAYGREPDYKIGGGSIASVSDFIFQDPSSNPVRSTRKNNEVFFRVKNNYCADSLSVCPTHVCIRTQKNDHVRTHVIDPAFHSEFGGLRKREYKTACTLLTE